MLDFRRYRVITFDCYGTLIDWESGILNALRPILSTHGAQVSDAEILSIYSELELEYESGDYRSYREILSEVVRGFGNRLRFRATPQEEQSLPDSVSNWLPFPDTVAALHKLKSRFQLAIISNIDDELFAASARRLEVDFNAVVTASQARAYKPSTKIFALAENRLGVDRREWLHAGQSMYHDVIPAKSLGISNVWVNRPSARPGAGAAKKAAAEPDLEVRSLAELADLAAPAK